MSFLDRTIPAVVFRGFVYPSAYGGMYLRGVVTNLPDRQLLTLYGWSDLPDDKCFKCDVDDAVFMQCGDAGIIDLLRDACGKLAWMAHCDEPRAFDPRRTDWMKGLIHGVAEGL